MTKQSLTNDPDIVTRFERQFTNNCTRWSFASSTAPKAEKVHNIKRDHQGVIINGVHYDWLVIYGRPQPHPSIKHTPQELSWMQEWPARIVWLNTVMEKNLGLHILPDGIRLSLTKKTALNLTTTYAGEPRSHRCLLFLSAHQSASSLFHQGLYIGKELRTLYCPLVYPLGLNKILERTTFMVQFLSAQLI